jgi:putative peptidoglycan lipid II flippase
MEIYMKKSFIKSVGIITLIAVISKILGFGRELLMAAYFGASSVTDAFFVASIIPVLMFTAVGMAITTGIAPLYAEFKGKSQDEASNFISVLATMLIVLSIVLTILFLFLTPVITQLMAPGFSENERHITNILTMIMLPSFCFYVISAIMTGILEYEQIFSPPALIAIPQNLFIIFAIIFLTEQYGIYGIAVATLLGAVSQFLIQYPFIKKFKVVRSNFDFKKYQNQIFNTIKVFSPVIIASVAYQVNAVVDRMVASKLPAGSVSALNYANKLMYLPVSILLLSLITVIFPSVVDAAIERGTKFIRLVFNGLNLITFVAIPIMVVMITESHVLVDLVYKRGAFGDKASYMTQAAFFFYSFGLVFIALKEYLNRCFIALKQTKVTMNSSVISVLVNIILSITLSKVMGVGGIALATSIAMFIQTILLFIRLPANITIQQANFDSFFKNFGKLVSLFIAVLLASLFASASLPISNAILHLILSFSITFCLFIVIAIIFKCQEILWLSQMIKKRD